MASEAEVPHITELKLEVETRATNDLTPPSKTDGFKQQSFPSYSNASIPMPGEWSQYPTQINLPAVEGVPFALNQAGSGVVISEERCICSDLVDEESKF
ncbi:hypothetical protein CPB85DRAFT_1443605 [Mucidula mucida]|nr:hypothetical protein CPB85DRAFT_1443605 [Mucidula mucida]